MKDDADLQNHRGLSFFKCGDEQLDGSITNALLLIFETSEIAKNKEELAALIARLSGHPKRALFVAVYGEGPEKIKGASRLPGSKILNAALPISVCVHASNENAPDPGLPLALTRWLLQLDVRSVRQFHFSGAEWPYRRQAKNKRRLLFLFPGPIFPMNRGSHQRAVNVLLALVEKSFDVTAIVAISKNQDSAVPAAKLSLIATEPLHFDAPQATPGIALARLTEKLLEIARRFGATGLASSRTFQQISLRRNSPALQRSLRRLDLEAFDAILVNYAWYLPSILRRRTRRPLLICDTHDVQYLRSFGETKKRPDFIAAMVAARTKRQELELLKRVDVALAISTRDQNYFASHLPSKSVTLALNGFEYAFAPARLLKPSRPLRFGFIGADMEANNLALTEILTSWWPEISKWSPESQLVIAGSIGKSHAVRRHGFLDDTIDIAGFVPNLSDFYEGLDVLLSPVLMAGGLNFKNAEAISAGVSLITSPLGASSLGFLDDVRIAESPNEVLQHLKDIESDLEGDLARRQRLQAALAAQYDLGPAIDKIIERLPSGT